MPRKNSVLVVDDEPLALKYFERMFQDRYEVLCAPSARIATRILETHGEAIGVVLSDQRMPGGSGLELLVHVRDRFPATIGLLTTAYSDAATLVQAINTGAVFSFVSKPWEMKELEHTLVRAFANRKDRIRMATPSGLKLAEATAESLEHSIAKAGFIAAKIGHYVNNAFCPVTFLIDQLIANHRASESLPLDFLEGLRKHIADVSSTLRELEETRGRLSPSSFSPVDVGAILGGVLQETAFMREQKKLRLETDFQSPLPTVRGVPQQIEKMFRFMIAEQLVSLPPESLVSVRLSTGKSGATNRHVKLDFEDYVPVSRGISEETLLQPFHVRGSDPKAFGVFLISCYFIARNHGGGLSTRVKKESGLIHSIILPCQRDSHLDPVLSL